MGIENFRDLDVWKKGMLLVKSIYELTENFPLEEKYGLMAQIKRSSVSIPSNIAEGFKRQHNKEFKQFLYITLGSLAELETQLEISYELKYAVKDKAILNDIDHLGRMLTALIKKLR